MDSKLVDSKLQVLYDKYRDRAFADNAQKEVENFRKQSFLVGMTTSVVAFAGNELIRLTMR